MRGPSPAAASNGQPPADHPVWLAGQTDPAAPAACEAAVGLAGEGPQWLGDWWDHAGQLVRPTLARLDDDDEAGLLYPGRSHAIAAPGGHGKSLLAAQLALRVLGEQPERPVLWLDYEANLPELVTRLAQLGGTRQEASRILYWRMPGAIADVEAVLADLVARHGPVLVVLDSVTAATAEAGLDESDNTGYRAWHAKLERILGVTGAADGITLVLIDHVSHKSVGGGTRGASDKRNAVTGAAYLLTLQRTPSPQRTGTGTLTVDKDRHSRAIGETVAHVAYTPQPDEDGGLRIHLTTPGASGTTPVQHDRDERIRRQLIDTLAEGAKTKRQLCDQVTGDSKTIRRVINTLASEGTIEADPQAPARGGHPPYRLATTHDTTHQASP